MEKRIRQYIGIAAAVLSYYLIHEGAHLLVALYYGVFKKINFMGLGVQIDVYADRLTDAQMGVFCLAGALATFVLGWLLIGLCKKICSLKSKLVKAVGWYVSLTFLVLDPVYLGVLCGFFGGGDMNGIKLLLPEIVVRIIFVVVGLLHGFVIWKYLLPEYTKAFKED